MSKDTKIEWTDTTWNPVTGCSKISPGCQHCYAEREWHRLSRNQKTAYFNRKFTDIQCHQERLKTPLQWIKQRRVFVNSMSDLFHDDVPYDFILAIFTTMAMAEQHQFQILTKRSERMLDITCKWNRDGLRSICGRQLPLRNVWLGVSIESKTYLERLEHLRRTHAAIRFISFEPLLEDLGSINLTGIDWVIVGGESGPKTRPMHPEWVRSIRDQCQKAEVPFFFKQWGEWQPDAIVHPVNQKVIYGDGRIENAEGKAYQEAIGFKENKNGAQLIGRVGKKTAGCILDGKTWEEMPTCYGQ